VQFSLFKQLLLIGITSALLASCGGGMTNTPAPPTTPTPSPTSSIGHVVLIVEENHSFDEVLGNSSAPYLNSLATQYGLATQYYADTHPSIGNYFMLTTGQIETNDDSFSGIISDDNVVRRLVAAGKTWKSYAQSLPAAGYTGGNSYPYVKRHNPFAYLSDVVNDSSQAANLVPFSQFATDLASGSLPNFSYVVPDALNDAHDGTLTQADTWLQQNLAPLFFNPQFQKDGLLIITFDEAEDSDSSHGGGHIVTILAGPKVKQQFQSKSLFQHQSTLRMILNSLEASSDPGASASAPDMQEFLVSH